MKTKTILLSLIGLLLCASVASAITHVVEATDFGLSYIDSAPKNGTPQTVFWEQNISTVGRVLLNPDGSECRGILSMPATLTNIPAHRIRSVVLKCDVELNEWQGERIYLSPITTPTKLVVKTWTPVEGDPPDNGPSWAYADGPVDEGDNSYPTTAWTTPGGDWDAAHTVFAAVDSAAGTATFDLTALWQADAARANLMANGAIVVMDDAQWSGSNMPRVNLYRPDIYVQDNRQKFTWMRITEYEQLEGATVEASLADDFIYVDSGAPSNNFSFINTMKILVNLDNDTRTHALFKLPQDVLDLDKPAYSAVTFTFPVNTTGDGGENVPVLMHPLTTTYETTEATWLDAETGTSWTQPGGDFDSAVAATGTYDSVEKILTFDALALLDNTNARANGLLMRMAPASTNGLTGSPRINPYRRDAIVRFTERPVATTYIDQDSPDSNFSSQTTMRTLLNASGSECRTLLRFSSELEALSPQQVGSLMVYFTRTGQNSSLDANPIVMQPVSSAFRFDEATWNHAADGVVWANAGGDFPAEYVQGTLNTNTNPNLFQFDIAPLLFGANSNAFLQNGAILRLLGEPGASSLMANTRPGTSADLYPYILAIPAELGVLAWEPTADGGLSLTVAGQDPLHNYAVYFTEHLEPDLVDWQPCTNLPASGRLNLNPTNPLGFYRIQRLD